MTASPAALLMRWQSFTRSPLAWATLLYFAMGIPFNAINGTASIMLKSLGYSDGDNTVLIGSIVIVWSLKPAWSAFLDLFSLHRAIIVSAQFLCGLIFAGIACLVYASAEVIVIVVFLWLCAFVSATLDLCADGLIITAATLGQQSKAVGLLGLGWHAGKIFASGLVILIASWASETFGLTLKANWAIVWLLIAGTLVVTAIASLRTLPQASPRPKPRLADMRSGLLQNVLSIFEKPQFWGMMAFILLYRLSEGLIISEGRLFIQTAPSAGGMGLTAAETSLIDGVFGSAAYIVGGLVGGGLLGRFGLKRSMVPFAIAMNIPHIGYLALSLLGSHYTLGLPPVAVVVIIEKFGYGLGFSACTLYMMQEFAPGTASMTHYAFATALMNLALVPTSTISGPLAERLGFPIFFALVAFASLPAIFSAIGAPFKPVGEQPPAVRKNIAVRRFIAFGQGIGTMIILTWAFGFQQLSAATGTSHVTIGVALVANGIAFAHMLTSGHAKARDISTLSVSTMKRQLDVPLTLSALITIGTACILFAVMM